MAVPVPSPTSIRRRPGRAWSHGDAVEEELFKKLESAHNVRIRFGVEVVSVNEDGDGVAVQTRFVESGEETT
jgi:2-polyprenyl-6-methoxyphenol hydroxylase-like FAD-dependent oxidoreductase